MAILQTSDSSLEAAASADGSSYSSSDPDSYTCVAAAAADSPSKLLVVRSSPFFSCVPLLIFELIVSPILAQIDAVIEISVFN